MRAVYPLWYAVVLFICCITAAPLFAGVTNPDISAIGQVLAGYSDSTLSAPHKRPNLALGEVELMLDAALNPYLNGAFVFSLGEEGIDIEEAYATVKRGLPLNLSLKAGKYRCGFGKLNPAHPHAYSFITPPRTMDPGAAKLIPGTESFDEVGLQASTLIPVAGSFATLISADLLQGDSFHPDTSASDFGWLLRMENSFIVCDQAATEVGLSLTRGTNDPAHGTKDLIGGGDLKTKITISPVVNLTVQVEGVYKLADHVDSLDATSKERRYGMYGFADMHFQNHYNAGLLYEQYRSPDGIGGIDRSIKPFIGFNLLEESTILRLAYDHFMPHVGSPSNTIILQFLFSMGPHKAHQF